MSRRFVLAASGLGLIALALPRLLDPAPRLVWNATRSVPIGLWRITPGAVVSVGDTVLAWAPDPARRLAAARGYLPSNVPLLKTVAATGGDTVCARGPEILVNGMVVAVRKARDRRGRRLPGWQGCQRLANGAVLLVNPAPDSFDGRYFGPVPATAIIGKARPLWLP
ncbi:S26 family signal peptidase [Caulobacter sp. RL271]|uniref:S26 family signal peptidase n=1 Tax=Caulobacter segnis TaxID=88688 RepID=A0ABY4ZSA2_9CAUL|nr:S26 family signal peptidase [Caulobacter segnis]USQ95259.1 S26 family signal peptidase [Caulobacter segnis]